MQEHHVRLLNALALLGINALLAYAFVDQFLFSDLPCPLCLLQRVGFLLAGFGFALNIIYAPRSSHYGFVILASIAGAAVAGRQVLLHITPGSGAYGDALFGLHFYSWAFIAFVTIIVGTALLVILEGRHPTSKAMPMAIEGQVRGTSSSPALIKLIGQFAVLIYGALLALNGAATFLQCSTGLCPDDPTHYELLDRKSMRTAPKRDPQYTHALDLPAPWGTPAGFSLTEDQTWKRFLRS